MGMLRSLVPAAAAMALCGCAVWPAGEDAKGREMRANAAPVLAALAAYHRQHGQYPLSLHELVPSYLDRIPFHPGLRFHRDKGIVEFSYAPSWPQTQEVYCAAHASETGWTCRAQ